MGKPLFSCIMPTKNRAKIIGSVIESIINQSEQDWELIIVDDHSTDNTWEVVKAFIAVDSRIKYFVLKNGTGPAAARNLAVKKANGEILVICDSDDINLHDRLEITKRAFQDGADIVYGKIVAINIINGKKGSTFLHEYSPELLKKINIIPAPTAAFKKVVFRKVGGYDENLLTSEDYDLWLKFMERGYSFKKVNDYLVIRQTHESNISKVRSFTKRKQDLNYVRRKHKLPTPSLEETLALITNKKNRAPYQNEGPIKFWFTR
ncbi:glycosyltransferase [Candidatus Berkelbacteria bacterium]|nr:glycosyltransferase [Candidatus Berkelbacteria bacterium]